MKTVRQILLAAILQFIAVQMLFGNISNVTISPVYLCSEVTVQATITPINGNLQTIKLMYRQAYTPSVFISIEMLPCGSGGNTYCATIPAQGIGDMGTQWYILAIDDYGTLQFHGTSEAPKFAYPLIKTNPKTKEMTLRIKREKLSISCKPLNTDDVAKYNGLRLQAYYMNDCGDWEQNAAFYDIQGDEDEFVLKLYGDSDTSDGVKNGFYDGDKILLKIITLKNHYDYRFQSSPDITYQTNGDLEVEDDLVLWTASGIEITGNNHSIASGETAVSTVDGTDFGKSNQPVSHNFTITAFKCNILYINGIRLDDNVNFTVSGVPDLTKIEVGETRDFTITYTGTASATTKVKVYNNSEDSPLYVFTVTGEYDAGITAVENTEMNKLSVYTVDRTIVVENATEMVSVFDIFGRRISMDMTTVTVPQAGIYVVRVGEKVRKVIVK